MHTQPSSSVAHFPNADYPIYYEKDEQKEIPCMNTARAEFIYFYAGLSLMGCRSRQFIFSGLGNTLEMQCSLYKVRS